jgi:hypothetical protein
MLAFWVVFRLVYLALVLINGNVLNPGSSNLTEFNDKQVPCHDFCNTIYYKQTPWQYVATKKCAFLHFERFITFT